MQNFWIEMLFQHYNSSTLENKMNTLSILIVFIFALLSIFNFKIAYLFLIFGLTIIIMMYYKQKETMQENFDNSKRYCNKVTSVSKSVNNQKWTSSNQKMVGGPNPKMKQPPIVLHPLADMTHWKTNNFANYPQINESSNFDLYRSGYMNNTPQKHCKNIQHSSMPNIQNTTQIDELFTHTIQPDVFIKSEVIEPVISNIGITYPEQNPHVTKRFDSHGNLFYEEESIPNENKQIFNHKIEQEPNYENVYDPRFTGYGTSYRVYNENVTGQPRFYYDDVNSVRMPNYISRSKIDIQPFSNDIDTRQLANQAYLNDTLNMRNDLMYSISKKINRDNWQKRYAPIRTSNSRMIGGVGATNR